MPTLSHKPDDGHPDIATDHCHRTPANQAPSRKNTNGRSLSSVALERGTGSYM